MSEPVLKQASVTLQHVLPHHLLSRLTGSLARCRWCWLKNPLIDSFIRVFQVDMNEAIEPEGRRYPHFNAFFTRALRTDLRPVDNSPGALVSPADGSISQLGRLDGQSLLQAKGRYFGAAALLGDIELAQQYAGGSFLTVYLSPRDYHRVHMPCDGRLRLMRHIPGRLFSVNEATAAQIDRLFARNERLVCEFESPEGRFVLVMVGAMIVASIETVWAGQVVPPGSAAQTWHYDPAPDPISLARGSEMGRFQLGSTVIMLFPPGAVRWNEGLLAGGSLRMGQHIGLRS